MLTENHSSAIHQLACRVVTIQFILPLEINPTKTPHPEIIQKRRLGNRRIRNSSYIDSLIIVLVQSFVSE